MVLAVCPVLRRFVGAPLAGGAVTGADVLLTGGGVTAVVGELPGTTVSCGVVPPGPRTEYTYGVLAFSPASVKVLPCTLAILTPSSPRRMSYVVFAGPVQVRVTLLLVEVARRLVGVPVPGPVGVVGWVLLVGTVGMVVVGLVVG